MENAAIYVRVSTTEQARSGLGLEDQELRCRAYARMMNLEIAAVLVDAGVSAGKALASRPAGHELLSKTRGRKPDVAHVIVLKLDRAFRNASDALRVTEDWDRRGVVFHVVDMGGSAMNLSSAVGRAFLTVAAAFAELERSLVSERTRAAARRVRARGKSWGGRAPYGFRVAEDSKLVLCPREQAVVELIREARGRGYSYRQIVVELEAQGVTGRTGKPLGLTQVARIGKRLEQAA
tara:strand:- start:1720 stop:2427 length:708 start_codon:yes stop_codon:yes gene_type:complete